MKQVVPNVVRDKFVYPDEIGGRYVPRPSIGVLEWRKNKYFIVVSETISHKAIGDKSGITKIIGQLPESELEGGKLGFGKKIVAGEEVNVPKGMIRVEFLDGNYRLCVPLKEGVEEYLRNEMNFYAYPHGVPAFVYRIRYPERMELFDKMRKAVWEGMTMEDLNRLDGPVFKVISKILDGVSKIFPSIMKPEASQF